MLTGLREYGYKHRDPEQLDALGLDRRTRGPEVRMKQQPERAYTPNQSSAMVSKEDPGIHGSGITPDERSRDLHRGPKVWGMGSGVTPDARYVEYGVRVRCAHACWYTHTAHQLRSSWRCGV